MKQKIKDLDYETKVMDLRLKDKDSALRGQWIRHKELVNTLETIRKIRRAEAKKAKQMLQLVYRAPDEEEEEREERNTVMVDWKEEEEAK
jgi:hypothetical protein